MSDIANRHADLSTSRDTGTPPDLVATRTPYVPLPRMDGHGHPEPLPLFDLAGTPHVRRAPVDVRSDDVNVPVASYREPAVAPRGTGYLPYRYAVAGLLTIGSQIPLRELEYFREPSLGKDLDIEIRVGKVGRGRPRSRARLLCFEEPLGVRYEEHFGRLAANFAIDLGDRIHVTLSSLLARSPHVAYTNVIEALLRFAIAARGHMLLHSACLEIDGRGVLLSAKTDTGKTGTVLRLLRERGARFLSDDMTIVAPDGTATCYPKPLTISSHTLRAVDPGDLKRTEWMWLGVRSRIHSKGGRGIGLALGNQNLPIMTVNALTQMLITPPKYVVDRLVACELRETTSVSEVFIIERGTPSLTAVTSEEALPELIENTDDAYGFPPFRYLAPALVVGGEEYVDLRQRELDVLTKALTSMRVRRMASDSFDWADRIPEVLHGGESS
jgi:dolichol-phosphate mannosyltransferase